MCVYINVWIRSYNKKGERVKRVKVKEFYMMNKKVITAANQFTHSSQSGNIKGLIKTV